MTRLAISQHLGIQDSRHHPRPTYRITAANPSRRLKRSVNLINTHDSNFGFGFPTDEDGPVTAIKWVVWALMVIVATPVLGYALYLQGVNDLLALILVLALFMWIINYLGKAVADETVNDFLASRLFGAPCQPRLYIQQAREKGQVDRLIEGVVDNSDLPRPRDESR